MYLIIRLVIILYVNIKMGLEGYLSDIKKYLKVVFGNLKKNYKLPKNKFIILCIGLVVVVFLFFFC